MYVLVYVTTVYKELSLSGAIGLFAEVLAILIWAPSGLLTGLTRAVPEEKVTENLFWTFQVFIDTFILQGKWTYCIYKYSIWTGLYGNRPGHGFITSPEDPIWSVPSLLVLNQNLFLMWIRLRNWIPASAFTGDWTKLSLTSTTCLMHRCVHINMGLG